MSQLEGLTGALRERTMGEPLVVLSTLVFVAGNKKNF